MRIIIVDDSKEYMTLLRRRLARALPDIEVTEYDPEQQGRPGPGFDWSVYDVLLLDDRLGAHEDGLQWLDDYRDQPGFPPAVIMTADGDAYVAVRAIKLGACDFIRKADATPERLAQILSEAVVLQPALRHGANPERHPKLERDAAVLAQWSLPSDHPPDGRRIGYRFVRLIGQGGSSRVYLAERLDDRRTLVLKIIDVRAVREPRILMRFIQEAELVGDLDTPFVVRFLDHGFTREYGYIAMEFFTRGDLKQRIERGITAADAVNYLRHIGYGLQAIHACGVVHRDLKPANVMFRADDSLALADFGISRRLHDDSDLTDLGSVLGTPNYMSPEQALGRGVDGRSDLYSAGIVFFEMLTGRKPYRAENAAALVYQHVHAPMPELPAELMHYQPVIARLLAKERADRFASANDLVAALDALEHPGPAH